jgi:hypothetical protein
MSSEQDVERELRAALSVSPSPDFEARVLRRVDADRASRWPARYGWLAAAAALVIAAGVFHALNRPSADVHPSPAPQIVEHTAPRALAPPHEEPARATTAGRAEPPHVDTGRASRQGPRTVEPEVMVPVNQMEAVRRLVRAVNEGRIEAPVEPPQGPIAPPAALAVAPVVIEPIPLSPLGPAGETPIPSIRGLK